MINLLLWIILVVPITLLMLIGFAVVVAVLIDKVVK
jgi:hypothetical protein